MTNPGFRWSCSVTCTHPGCDEAIGQVRFGVPPTQFRDESSALTAAERRNWYCTSTECLCPEHYPQPPVAVVSSCCGAEVLADRKLGAVCAACRTACRRDGFNQAHAKWRRQMEAWA